MIEQSLIRDSRFNGARNAFRETPSDQWKDMTVVVIGCGPVALCAMICALEYKPARIVAIDSVPDRLKRAESLGCIPLNFKELDVVKEILRLTNGNGAHAVIEVVGLSPALKTAFDVVCPGGKISSVGKLLYLFVRHPLLTKTFLRGPQWRAPFQRRRLLQQECPYPIWSLSGKICLR